MNDPLFLVPIDINYDMLLYIKNKSTIKTSTEIPTTVKNFLLSRLSITFLLFFFLVDITLSFNNKDLLIKCELKIPTLTKN